MAPPAQSRGGTPDYEHWFGGRGDETQEKKRTGKLPILDTMGSNLAEETVLEFSWQRNGLRTWQRRCRLVRHRYRRHA